MSLGCTGCQLSPAKLQKTAEQEAANALEAEHRVKALETELKNCQQSK